MSQSSTGIRRALIGALVIAAVHVPQSYAAWTITPSAGSVTYVRSYPGNPGELRVELGVSGAVHNCGTQQDIYYFDSNKIGMDTVKAVLASSLTALTTDKLMHVTYDCAAGSGGYGWGIGVQILK